MEITRQQVPTVSDFINDVNKDSGFSISQASFEETLKLVPYQNPLVVINCCKENVIAVAGDLYNPSNFYLPFAIGTLGKIAKTVKYGFGAQMLTDEQSTNLAEKLLQDDDTFINDKIQILGHAFSLPGIKEKLLHVILKQCELMIGQAKEKRDIEKINQFLEAVKNNLNLNNDCRDEFAKVKANADEKLKLMRDEDESDIDFSQFD